MKYNRMLIFHFIFLNRYRHVINWQLIFINLWFLIGCCSADMLNGPSFVSFVVGPVLDVFSPSTTLQWDFDPTEDAK